MNIIAVPAMGSKNVMRNYAINYNELYELHLPTDTGDEHKFIIYKTY